MTRTALIVLTTLLVPSLAHAQQGFGSPNARKTTRTTARAAHPSVAQRTLVPAKNTIQILAGPTTQPGAANVVFDDYGVMNFNFPEITISESLPSIDPDITVGRLGLAYGIDKTFGVALALPSFLVSGPDGDGASSSNSPFTLSGTAQLYTEGIFLGAKLALTPSIEDDDLKMVVGLGMPFAIHIGESVMLDGAVDARIMLAEQVNTDLSIPIRLTVQGTEHLFFGARSGVNYPSVDPELMTMPLGLFAGYTIAGERRPLVDITASLTWPGILSAINEFETPITEIYVLGIGVTGHIDLDPFTGG